MGSIYKRLLRHPLRLAAALAPALLSPARVKGIVEVLFASGHGGAGGNGDGPPLPRHELFSIVVASDQRRRGVAERLYRRLCAGFRDRGVTSFRILVGKQLDAANRFYHRMGARPVTEVQLHEGAVSTIYVQDLNDESRPRSASIRSAGEVN
ncbi:GNAT family N-acetyltransferase [Jhaorihella thermophila]|uniref:Acetyltransferase (GNAT) family protein n=2 Tax=Jhaorihella thermophila TaxID=488547 RepID=A0A1H5YKK3_9RHOB|nr:GNAT family N-acetyltransferase [Jhaorihella thermophila]SEG24679.1 Acetyltransferase (GNAT) family protein [Jhaorihella thermophila]